MTDNKARKEKIVNNFRKYCSVCDGLCCKKGVFSVFGWEMKDLPLAGKDFEISSQSGERGETKDIVMKDRCIFLGKNGGCVLPPGIRATDCITFPFYPKIRKTENGLEIECFYIHKECSFYDKAINDKNIIQDIKKYWEEIIKNVPAQEILDWVGQDAYWDDWYKNTVIVNY
ncbi:MAG: hypothetical protein PHE24_04670 [Patescibacteria group bacterium]|nr:hypothetical protein [Patescibacteria group bacterium]